MRRTTPGFILLFGLLFTSIQAQKIASQDGDKIVDKFILCYKKKDLNGILQLWDSQSPAYEQFRSTKQFLFEQDDFIIETIAPYCILTNNPLNPSSLEYRLQVQIRKLDASPPQLVAGDIAPQNRPALATYWLWRSLHVVKQHDGWKITSYGSTPSGLVSALLAPDNIRIPTLNYEKSFARFPGNQIALGQLLKEQTTLGNYLVTSLRFKEAKIILENVRALALEGGLRAHAGSASLEIGQMYTAQGKYHEATNLYVQAIADLRNRRLQNPEYQGGPEPNEDIRLAATMYKLSVSLVAERHDIRALHTLLSAHALLAPIQDPVASRWLAAIDRLLGETYLRHSPIESLQYLQSAEAWYRLTADTTDSINMILIMAHAHLALGRYRLAFEHYATARERCIRWGVDAEGSRGIAMLGMAVALHAQGDTVEGLKYVKEAIQFLKSQDAPELQAYSLIVYAALLKSQSAPTPNLRHPAPGDMVCLDATRKALDIFFKKQNLLGIYACCVTLVDMKSGSKADIAYWVKLLAQIRSKGAESPIHSTLGMEWWLPYLCVRKTQSPKARPLHECLAQWADGQKDAWIGAMAHLNLALLYSETRNGRAAIQQTRFVTQLSTQGKGNELAWRAMNIEATVNAQQRHYRIAQQLYEKSIQILEASRENLLVSQGRGTRFLDDKASLYREMVTVLVNQGNNEGALEYAERLKGHTLLHALYSHQQEGAYTQEYQRYFGGNPDIQVALQRRNLMSLLPSEANVILEFCVTEGQTYIFEISRKGASPSNIDISVHTINLKEANLQEMVSKMYRIVASPATLPFQQSNLPEELFKRLFSAVHLQGKQSILVIPDGAIWKLPFAALKVAPSRYLYEDYDLCHGYSLAWLYELKRSSVARLRAPSAYVGFGNAIENSQNSLVKRKTQESTTSKEARSEVNPGILGYDKRSRGLSYEDVHATKGQFTRSAWRGRVVYLPVHGVFNNEHPLESHIKLSPSNLPEGWLNAYDMSAVPLNADLMVMPACEMARGDVRAGEGLIGMMWACCKAGALTTITSQWKVPIAETQRIMKTLHHVIGGEIKTSHSQMTKPQALRYAILSLIKEMPELRTKPYAWAGLLMVGDAGRLDFSPRPIANAPKPAVKLLSKDQGKFKPAVRTYAQVKVEGEKKAFSTNTQARPNDIVDFNIFLGNIGLGLGRRPYLRVHLDPRLTYVAESSIFVCKEHNENKIYRIPDKLIRIEPNMILWAFNDMRPQADASVYLMFRTKVASSSRFSADILHHAQIGVSKAHRASSNVLRSYTLGGFDGCSLKSNDVVVNVLNESAPSHGLELMLETQNKTLKDTQWHQTLPAICCPTDTLSFHVTVFNSGNKPEDMRIKLQLPGAFKPEGHTKIYSFRQKKWHPADGADLFHQGLLFKAFPPGNDNMVILEQNVSVPRQKASDKSNMSDIVATASLDKEPWLAHSEKNRVLVTPKRGLFVLNSFQSEPPRLGAKNVPFLTLGDTLVNDITVLNNRVSTTRNINIRLESPQYFTLVKGSLRIDNVVQQNTLQDAIRIGILISDMHPGFTQVLTLATRLEREPSNLLSKNSIHVEANAPTYYLTGSTWQYVEH